MNFLNKKILRKFLYISLFFFAFLNFNYNFLNIAGTSNFYNTPATNSEVEATDGILYGLKTGHYTLGRIQRGDFTPMQYRGDFKNRNDEGLYRQYVTAYGLQVKVYGYLVKNYNFNLENLHVLNSSIFSLIIVLFSIFLQKNFTLFASIVFALTLSMSPWIINHAKDIKFMTWASFLPLISIAMMNYFTNLKKIQNMILCIFLIFFTLIFKCLFGYEYISTIMSITFFYFIFVILKLKVSRKYLALATALSSTFIFFGFLLSFVFQNIIIHTNQDPGIDRIKHRIYSNLGLESKSLEKNPCLNESFISIETTIEHCKINNNYFDKYDGLSRIEVLGRYFIFRNLLPWVGNSEKYLNENFKSYLKRIFWNREYSNIKSIFSEFDYKSFVAILLVALQSCLFILIIFLCFKKIFFKGDLADKILLLGSLLGSISWFVMAKNYAFIHMHLCYVAWSLSFLPFAITLLAQKINISKINFN